MLLGAVLDETDDEAEYKKGAKNKKGAKRGPKASKAVGKADGDDEAGGGKPANLLPALESALLAFRREISDLDGLATAAAAHLYPVLERKVAGERARLAEAGASERRRAVLAAQEALAHLSTNVGLTAKAVEAVAAEETLSPGQVGPGIEQEGAGGGRVAVCTPAPLFTLPTPLSPAHHISTHPPSCHGSGDGFLESLDKALLKSVCAEWLSCRLRCEALAAGAEAAEVEALASQNAPAARKELMAKLGSGAAKEALQ
eukprot:scaffold10777_cov77-Isochrysis_galbana.AAC.1